MQHVVQVALKPSELPPDVARQLGQLYLKRYRPNPAITALRGFKDGSWRGVLVWVLREDGKVMGWALRAKQDHEVYTHVMLFVTAKFRRMGLGTLLLDTAKRFNPCKAIQWYPHDTGSKAFFSTRG